MTRTDHLTSIANRHAFDQDFTLIFDQPSEKINFAQKILYLIDLDGMKRINDSYGHLRGDQLLCTFASLLSELETKGCKAYRIGGDEFTIVADASSEKDINTAITHIEKQLYENGFSGVGVSFGVAKTHECESANDMISLADKRMYEYKTSHRNARADDVQPVMTATKG